MNPRSEFQNRSNPEQRLAALVGATLSAYNSVGGPPPGLKLGAERHATIETSGPSPMDGKF